MYALCARSERQLKLVKSTELARDHLKPARSRLPLAAASLTVTVNSYSHSHDRVTFLFLPPGDLANRSPSRGRQAVDIKVTTDQ